MVSSIAKYHLVCNKTAYDNITNIANNFVDGLAPINKLSIFQYYDTAGAFNYGVNLATTLSFSIMIICLTIFGYVKFTKRDLQI